MGLGVGFRVATAAVASIAIGGTALHAQRRVDDHYPFKPGDLVGFGPNSYPAGAVYRVAGCDPVDKPYRECRMIRIAPDAETHERSFTMNNYTNQLELLGSAPAQPQSAPAAVPTQTVTPDTTAAAAAGGGICPRTPYGGPVRGDQPASAALFQRKIADTITMGNTPRGWYGVRLTNFRVGGPIRNMVGQLPGGGASRVNNGAPVGALMYPVSTTMTVCEGWNGGGGSFRTSDKKYLCFVSAAGEWTCGASN